MNNKRTQKRKQKVINRELQIKELQKLKQEIIKLEEDIKKQKQKILNNLILEI